ncbi:MAG TPA: integrase core domain-containing protein [Actinomycetota bacterium]|nr:integrase core domain-containing protein [Actinomycetota bacterium]
METVWLKTLYALVFLELGTRRVHVTPVTRNPDSAWVAQQARNVAAALDDQETPVRFLIRDRDTKFTRPFDAVFEAGGTRILCTPIRAPNANAHAERWVGSVRAECLDWTLILGRRHLERVLRDYAEHFNGHRPHPGLGLMAPDRATIPWRSAPAAHVRDRGASPGRTAGGKADHISLA